MPTTRVIITRDGKVIIEGVGYQGQACLVDLQKLLQALNQLGVKVRVEKQELKPEIGLAVTEKAKVEVGSK